MTDPLEQHEPSNQQVGLEDEAAFETCLVDDTGATSTQIPEPDPSTSPPWFGKRLGKFKLLRPIGRGSMGVVIQALDVHLQRMVALKVLRKHIKGTEKDQMVHQFLREARAAAILEHPNVASVYEINEHQGWWYIAMELVEGDSLASVVKAAGPLSPARACPVIADAATALAAAHAVGITHRDIKPTNLLITRSGRCKIVDFGLVRLDDPNDPFDFTLKSVGTPQYMAPELCAQKAAGPAVDIYALGATLYYALTGKPPYTAKKIVDVLKKHREEPVPDLSLVIPNAPHSLVRLIQQAMAKDPADRPDAATIAAMLRAEAIDSRPEESGTWAFGSGAHTHGMSGDHIERPPMMVVSRQLVRWVTIAMVTAAISAIAWWGVAQWLKDQPARDAKTLDGMFTDTPATYGVLEPGDRPAATEPTAPPTFSWKGRLDVTGMAYIASRSGTKAWPIDAPQALLIRYDQAIAYPTAQDAQADGKMVIAH